MEIQILNKKFYDEYPLPKYATDGSAAIDLRATKEIWLESGETDTISTGLAIHIGSEYCNAAALILPRSSIGKMGIVIKNTAGLIDEDYQGGLILELYNNNSELYPEIVIPKGDRIAQLLFFPIIKPSEFQIVEEFSNTTVRGVGGFGSTNNER